MDQSTTNRFPRRDLRKANAVRRSAAFVIIRKTITMLLRSVANFSSALFSMLKMFSKRKLSDERGYDVRLSRMTTVQMMRYSSQTAFYKKLLLY
jgi:hypothetical protein